MNSFLFCVTARSLELLESYLLHYLSGVLQWHSVFGLAKYIRQYFEI